MPSPFHYPPEDPPIASTSQQGQPPEPSTVTCRACGQATKLTEEDRRRVAADYVAEFGTAGLRPDSGDRGDATPTTPAQPERSVPPPRPLTPDGIRQLDPLLGPRRLRGAGGAHWLRLGRRPGLRGERYDGAAAAQLVSEGASTWSLSLVPSEHGLALLRVDGLVDGPADPDALFEASNRVAQRYGGLAFRPADRPVLAFACSNTGRHTADVAVDGLSGSLLERIALSIPNVSLWLAALSTDTLGHLPEDAVAVTKDLRYQPPTSVDQALAEFRSWFLPLPDGWHKRAARGVKQDGWLANTTIWDTFKTALLAWQLPLDGWNPTKLALWMSREALGTPGRVGSGADRQRGRYGLALRGHLESLLP